jgi:cytochrome oxidase Cu insertion factor (SCO1/SenC/PrrC family)
MKLDARRTLLLLAAVCVLPVVASYLTYYVIKPQKRTNYGELLEPTPLLPAPRLPDLQGQPFSLDQLRGRWVMVSFDDSKCDERCRNKLYNMRQVRTAQGKEMDRIERLWLLRDGAAPAPDLMQAHRGLHVARAADAALVARFAAGQDPAAHIYLIDPLGNLMLRFPENPDPKRMIKDLERLLKYSRIG